MTLQNIYIESPLPSDGVFFSPGIDIHYSVFFLQPSECHVLLAITLMQLIFGISRNEFLTWNKITKLKHDSLKIFQLIDLKPLCSSDTSAEFQFRLCKFYSPLKLAINISVSPLRTH